MGNVNNERSISHGMFFNRLQIIDQVTFKIITFYLQIWKDEYLVWDPTKYDNIELLHEDSTMLWLPDFMSYNM